TKLATIGGVPRRGGGFGAPPRTPGSLLTFSAINGVFDTALGPLAQNGIDMAPTKAEIDTWQSGCNEFSATAAAWKAALAADVAAFNMLLTKNSLPTLRVGPSAVTAPGSCSFAAGPRRR